MNNYIELALRTNSHIVGKHGRNSIDFAHACLGLVTELYELENATDEHNRREEEGDMCWYIALACHAMDLDWPQPYNLSVKRPLSECVFELSDIAKKWFAYGKRPETVVVESYLLMIVSHLGDIPDAQRRNIKKLYSRYPESFDARLAIVRDIDAELKAMHDA